MAVSVEESLGRIADIDPRLHSVVAIDPGARDEAGRLNLERREGRVRGPLHGTPVVIKDNIDASGLATTAGSTALLENRPALDAPVVAALRAAGAVVVGKANLSEWANFRSTRSASGWSAVAGLTANPYALDRSAGGSSSGSAAAVAAGLVPIALGTETDGSILCPASLCGCVGVKPTVGSVSCKGVVPISATQDVVGPIARTVRLAAAVLDAIAGSDHLAAVEAGVDALRVGLPRSTGWDQRADVSDLCEAAAAALGRAGAVVVEDVHLALPATLDDDEMEVLLHEFRVGVDTYLREHPGAGPRSLEDLIAHNAAEPSEVAYFGQDLFEKAARTGGLEDDRYLRARQRCRRAGREEGIDAALARRELDALAVPSYMPAWKSDLVCGDPRELYSPAQLSAVAGYPALTVPVGMVAGLPVGLTLLGTAHSDAVLLRLGAAVEAALDPLPSPTFREPTAG